MFMDSASAMPRTMAVMNRIAINRLFMGPPPSFLVVFPFFHTNVSVVSGVYASALRHFFSVLEVEAMAVYVVIPFIRERFAHADEFPAEEIRNHFPESFEEFCVCVEVVDFVVDNGIVDDFTDLEVSQDF